MNWGIKIVIGMGLFIAFIVALGVIMVNSENDALVDTDYYEKGLEYNSEYKLKEQAIKDNATPQITVNQRSVEIKFKTPSAGSVKMMRTSDKKMDRVLKFKTDSLSILNLLTDDLAKGQWRVIIEWKNGKGTSYLDEQEVMLP